MGRDLRGKELGIGLSQQKDGLYAARFLNKNNKRITKRSKSLQECKKWLADAEFLDKHITFENTEKMTVNTWYQFWIEEKKKTVRQSTYIRLETMYRLHIKDEIGMILLRDVKPMHCQMILNKMAEKNYKSSSIGKVKATLFNLLESAKDNDVILVNPCKKSVKSNIGRASDSRDALDIETQRKLLQLVTDSIYENQIRFVLQTGLRAGELIGLKWSDINFENQTIKIQRTMQNMYGDTGWNISDTKSEAGKRVIPLTDEAIRILKSQKEKNARIKVLPIEYCEFIFLNKKGLPITNAVYDIYLDRICKNNNMKKISMHILRHTFATRCIEGGVQPKTLQIILGHSKISTTMDLYVSVTEETKKKEIDMVADVLNVV